MEANLNVELSKNEEIIVSNGLIYRFIKRSFDIFSSLFVLLVFGWFILLLCFIKFCEDGHNPIYTSIRVGKNGKDIKFHKIRSMRPDADKMKQELINQGLNEADGPVFKMKDDPRITKFGKFLRKMSLDELPQLWDVLLGRLSIVGPRSPLRKEVEKYNEYQMHRLDVKGGILCLWQITKNRHQMSFDEWVDLDIKYVQTRSIWLDLKIIIKGAWMFLFDRSGE